MMKTTTTTNKPSSSSDINLYYAAADKVLSNPDIILTTKLIASFTEKKNNISLLRFCAANYPKRLSLKLARVYVSKEPRVTHEIRESAIKLLNELLSSKKEASLELSFFKELSKTIIACLAEQENPYSCFKILTEIVSRIANELFTVHESTWRDLRDYISSKAETEFARSVYVFLNLHMPLDGEDFVVPVMKRLAPQILKRLSVVEEIEDREWSLAFIGGFCAAVQLLETTRVDLVEDLAYEMLESVNRGMKIGLLVRALQEVEVVVMKQLCWYCSNEFRFVSGLVRRIDAFTVTEDKKSVEIVLERIKIVLDKKMKKTFRYVEEIGNNGDGNWLNKKF
ncbi:unnamed protein product [Cochlearia groenlandica]